MPNFNSGLRTFVTEMRLDYRNNGFNMHSILVNLNKLDTLSTQYATSSKEDEARALIFQQFEAIYKDYQSIPEDEQRSPYKRQLEKYMESFPLAIDESFAAFPAWAEPTKKTIKTILDMFPKAPLKGPRTGPTVLFSPKKGPREIKSPRVIKKTADEHITSAFMSVMMRPQDDQVLIEFFIKLLKNHLNKQNCNFRYCKEGDYLWIEDVEARRIFGREFENILFINNISSLHQNYPALNNFAEVREFNNYSVPQLSCEITVLPNRNAIIMHYDTFMTVLRKLKKKSDALYIQRACQLLLRNKSSSKDYLLSIKSGEYALEVANILIQLPNLSQTTRDFFSQHPKYVFGCYATLGSILRSELAGRPFLCDFLSKNPAYIASMMLFGYLGDRTNGVDTVEAINGLNIRDFNPRAVTQGLHLLLSHIPRT